MVCQHDATTMHVYVNKFSPYNNTYTTIYALPRCYLHNLFIMSVDVVFVQGVYQPETVEWY